MKVLARVLKGTALATGLFSSVLQATSAFADEAPTDALADSAEASLGAETAPSPEDAAHDLGAAPSAPEMDPDALAADPETRLPTVDLSSTRSTRRILADSVS